MDEFCYQTIDLPALMCESKFGAQQRGVETAGAMLQRRMCMDGLSVGVLGCSGFSPRWPASRTPPSVSRSPG